MEVFHWLPRSHLAAATTILAAAGESLRKASLFLVDASVAMYAASIVFVFFLSCLVCIVSPLCYVGRCTKKYTQDRRGRRGKQQAAYIATEASSNHREGFVKLPRAAARMTVAAAGRRERGNQSESYITKRSDG